MSGTTSTSVPSNAASAPGVGGFTHKQVLVILTGLMLGMFLAALDQNIVATAIRTIGDDLHGLSVQAWVTTAYLITSTVSTPLYGKLSDLYGRKPFFLIAITIFITGSAACAFATSMYMLAAFRAYQGLGAGGLFSLALAIIGDIVSPRDRAKYQGYFLAVFGTASVLGPVLGGFFAGANSILTITGWRWVFLVNVPIGIVALYVVWRTLNLPNTHRPARIDWVGVVSLFVCLVPLLVVAEQGQKWGWGSGKSLGCYALGIAGLALFILAEHRMGDDALIPLRFFQNRVFSLTSIVGVLVGMGLFGGISVLPLYLQIVRGVSPTESGLLLIPLTAGLMVGAIISGQMISRTGKYKIFPVVGSLLCVIALVLMSFIGADTPLWQTDLYGAYLASASATSCSRSPSPPRTRCPPGTSAWRHRRRRSSARWAARLGSPYSSRCCSARPAATSLTPTRPPRSQRLSRPSRLTRASPALPRTNRCSRSCRARSSRHRA